MDQKNVMLHSVKRYLWNWAILAKMEVFGFFSTFLRHCLFFLTNPFEKAIGFLNFALKDNTKPGVV